MTEINEISVVGLFGFIGSGKSYIINSLKEIKRFNPISKEEVGVLWYIEAYGVNNLEGYERALYNEFKRDPLFLIRESLKSVKEGKINVIDSVNTPIEDNYLRENYDYLLIGVWRRTQERMKSILSGRDKLVRTSEPRDEKSFLTLDELVKNYMYEGGCLFCSVDEMIINEGNNLMSKFVKAIDKKWK